jgi:hypothetical protein
MTKEEFKERAQKIFDENEGYAGEDGHMQVDRLMEECLRSLGYGEGIDIMNKMSNFWYS